MRLFFSGKNAYTDTIETNFAYTFEFPPAELFRARIYLRNVPAGVFPVVHYTTHGSGKLVEEDGGACDLFACIDRSMNERFITYRVSSGFRVV